MNLLEEYGIKEDSRFKQARKEGLLIFLLVVVETIWVFSFAYWGEKTDVSQYSYIMGMPAWYFWAFLGAGIIFPLLSIVVALNIKNCTLEDQNSKEVKQ